MKGAPGESGPAGPPGKDGGPVSEHEMSLREVVFTFGDARSFV